MKISILIPAYNEEKRLQATVTHALHFLEESNLDFELIIVDDGSTDRTRSIAETLSKNNTHVRIEQYKKNRGKGYAVKAGVLTAKGDYIFYMDADGATPIEVLPIFLRELMQGAQIVIGSRHLKESLIHTHQPRYRRILGRAANMLIRIFLLPGITDSQCGFKGFKKEVAVSLFFPLRTYRWGFDFEILTRARRRGYRIVERPVQWLHRGGSRIRPIKSFVGTFVELLSVFIFVRLLGK